MANNTLIGAIRAEATLESGKFVDGAKKIRQEAKATETQLKSSFSAMGTAVKGFGGAVTAGLSIGLLGGLAKKALDYAAAIKTTAAQVGVTTRELQEFGYAASQVGIKTGESDKGLEKLNTTMGKALAGSKTAIAAFKAVGVSIDDIKTKSKVEIFGQIGDQMIKQGGAARNAAAANAIFGESASKLYPLLDKGSQGINELSAAAQRLGVVLSDQQIQQADETARKLEDVKRVLAAQISGVVADNASSILTLADALAKLTSAIVNFLGSNPAAALGILGALAGSRFGLPGAALGGFTGMVAGANMATNRGFQPGAQSNDLLRYNTRKMALDIQGRLKAGKPVSQGEVARLESMTAKLNASQGRTSTGFTGEIPQFLATGGGGRNRRARTPRAPRDRSDDVAFQFDQELRRAQMDTLRAQQSLATNYEERAKIALQLLDMQKADQEAELANRVRKAERDFAEGKIDAQTMEEVKVQAEKLKAEYASKDAAERQAISDELAAQKAQDAAAFVDSGYDLEIEMLQLQGQLADTAAERRDVELRILAVMKEQERARLEAVLADKDSSELAKEEARRRLAMLDEIYSGRAEAARAGTRGPLEDFKARWGDIGEENEQALVNGLEGIADALSEVTEGWDAMKEAGLDALKSLFQELLRNQFRQLLAGLIPQGGINFGGIFGGGSTPPISGYSLGGAPGFHSGGSMVLRGIPGFDRNVISMNGIPIARAEYGERLTFTPANDRRGNARREFGGVTMNVYTPDADSFRKSDRQITRELRRKIS